MILPLIVPQKKFTDIFGNQCAYSEMNPSLYYDPLTEEYTVLVRLVNYRKFNDRSYVLYENQSNSEYMISRSKSLTSLEWNPLIINYEGLEIHWTHWKGVEDIRFIDSKTVLCCIPELHPSGNPTLFTATLERSTLTNFQQCSPAPNEKNWMPFEDKVIYSTSPFIIKSVKEDNQTNLGVIPELEGYHGSTNGIKIDDGWIFLIHKNEDQKVIHRWILYLKTSLKFSAEFIFFPHSYIEFPCSLVVVEKEHKWIVSLGVNDDKAFLIDIDPKHVLERLVAAVEHRFAT